MKNYELLLVYLLSETDKKQRAIIQNGGSKFGAKNNSQVYRAAVLPKAYCEYTALKYFWRRIHLDDVEPELVAILEKLGILYGLWSLDKHLIYFYEGNFANGPHLVQLVKEAILTICSDLKPDIVGIIDALAPPDFIINSILGAADGKVRSYIF